MRQYAAMFCLFLPCAITLAADAPHARDERLTIELFAEHPDIMTPTGLAIAADGRVFVAESHTHFRPDDYDGPPADRILIFEDTDGDGRADKRTIFHEGFTHVMDIEFHHDGSLYVATRRDIHRLRDTDGDDKADEVTRIVWLNTEGNYPHNGLSGLAFDFDGGLNFGLGENLGAAYTLHGTDSISLSGGGEGGSTYHVQPDGKRLRRVSTGWWNPYGMCTDAFGRVFGTDNDPGSSPPCRLIQVIEGGNYGYEYRYGRTGLHPLICWNGEIPGTLPMIAGTGEAPCAIVAYEAAAFPREYLGNLFVPCWADHRVERYTITQRADKGLVDAQRDILIEAPDDFRPVGIDVAPDGTVYISDWVSSSYSLHKQGRIWRIRPKELNPRNELSGIQELRSIDRRTRERAVKERLEQGGDAFDEELMTIVSEDDSPRVRATAVQALTQVARRMHRGSYKDHPLYRFGNQLPGKDLETDILHIRMLSVARIPIRGGDSLPVPAKAARSEFTMPAATDAAKDPVLFQRYVESLSMRLPRSSAGLAAGENSLVILLAARKNADLNEHFAKESLDLFLNSPDAETRFAAVKWIADDKLVDYRPDLQRMLNASDLDYRLFRAVAAAIDRLDNKEPADQPSEELLLARIKDAEVPPAIRSLCLRMIAPNANGLMLNDLIALTHHADAALRLEAVRTLANHPDVHHGTTLFELATDVAQPEEVQAAAIAGLATAPDLDVELLVKIAGSDRADLRDEALRSLVGATLPEAQKESLAAVAKVHPTVSEAVGRLLQQTTGTRPPREQTDAWKQLLTEGGDASAGERIFFGTKVGTCSKCHTIDGRGSAVGPDLSKIRQRIASEGVEWLLETILQPSKQMAPEYTPWQIMMTDGRMLVGLPRRKGGNQEAYLGLDGKEFTVTRSEMEFHREMPTSIMPEGLLQSLTVQELNDLMAFIVGTN